MLTSRQRAVLRNFLENNLPVHIKELASTFNVSVRTVKYDLDAIRKWLDEVNIELYSHPKKGVWLDTDLPTRNLLYSLLEEIDNPQLGFFDQAKRSEAIMFDLLTEKKSIYISDWEKKFKVSRQTIHSDLSLVEPLLEEWGVNLSRENKGIRVIATEKQKRLSLEHLFQKAFDPQEMFWIVKAISRGHRESENLFKRYGHLLKLNIEFNYIYKAIADFTRLIHQHLGISLSDRVVIGLFIRVAISIQRVTKGYVIEDESYNESLFQGNDIFILFKKVMEQLCLSIGLTLSNQEVVYASLPLIGKSSQKINVVQTIDPYKLTEKLVGELSEASQIPFHHDPDLINLLFNHLSDKLTKIQQGIVEPNPFLNDIARNYNELFKLVETSYLKYIYAEGIVFTESDIGYIVLHFQASIERLKDSRKYKALVVCSTGRGMARLLKNKLERDMKDLIVAGTCSILEVEKMAEFLDVDLIISMLPVECSIPVIHVNAIPTDKDLQDIKTLLKKLPEPGSQLKINSDDQVQSDLEALTQEVIIRGLELARIVTSHFTHYLPNSRSEGLFQHILFMVNRLTFNNTYSTGETGSRPIGHVENRLRQELIKTVSNWGIDLPEEELEAIMAYFIWDENGEKDINVGS